MTETDIDRLQTSMVGMMEKLTTQMAQNNLGMVEKMTQNNLV